MRMLRMTDNVKMIETLRMTVNIVNSENDRE